MSVLVILEQRGQLKKCALEAAVVAGRVARDSGVDLDALYIGAGFGEQEALAGLGIGRVFAYEGPALAHYAGEAYVSIACEVAKETGATAIVGSATALGKAFLASVAAHLDVELLQDCVDVSWRDGLVVRKPIYAGKILSDVRITSTPAMATVRPNVVAIVREGDAMPDVVRRSAPAAAARMAIKEAVESEPGTVELTEAKIIVSGGRGIGGPEAWPTLKALCDALGAALGASRAAVDAGWIHHSHQVGQTGKVVSPDLYIACGISGAIQHQAGMRTSRIVVAINKDPNSPVFKICDYGIVGDLHEIVPLLTEEARKATAS